jgi:hypothetical protein
MNEKIKQTWTAEQRQSRIDALKEEIKRRKRMTKAEIYRFALNDFRVSMRVIDDYMKELELMRVVECRNKELNYEITFLEALPEDFIIWKGEGTTDELHNA